MRLCAVWKMVLALGLACAGVACSSDSGSGGSVKPVMGTDGTPRPNVLVISLDTTRADHIGAYSDKVKTPQLDRLAAEGIVFEDLSTVATTTLSSHTSLFTGTYPFTHGVARNGFLVHEDNVLLAEVLAAEGYRTAAILGSYALEPLFGMDQGFQYVNQDFNIALAQGNIFDQAQRNAERVTNAALDWMSTVEDESTFLFVHYFDAHQPYTPPAPYDQMYWKGEPPEGVEDFPEAASRRIHQRKSGAEVRSVDKLLIQGLDIEHMREPDIEPLETDLYLAAQYAGEVSYMDEHIGRLFDELRERGLWENTVVVVVGDHGETFWEHGDQWNHGLAAYQTTVHIPGLLKLPGSADAGARVKGATSNIDLMPTVLDVLGLASPERVEGRSLLPVIGPDQDPWLSVFGEATQPRSASMERGGWANRNKPNFVRIGSLKLIVSPYLDLEEVYDLATDPEERQNLAPLIGRDGLRTMRETLDQWRERADPFDSPFIPETNPQAMMGLRRLGYLGK